MDAPWRGTIAPEMSTVRNIQLMVHPVDAYFRPQKQ